MTTGAEQFDASAVEKPSELAWRLQQLSDQVQRGDAAALAAIAALRAELVQEGVL